jgi:polysaccharide biosynthesis transport protein
MDLAQYARVLRAHRLLILVCIVLCTAAAAALAWTRTPLYAAHTQLFLSVRGSTPGDIYEGGLFSEQRIQSYAELVSSPTVLRRVIEDLGLPYDVQRLEGRVHASVPTDTVLIDVTVTDPSAQRAAAIATSLGNRFSGFVNDLEAAQRGGTSPIRVSVTSPATVPTAPYSPKKLLYLVLGATLGLLLGIAAAVLRELHAASRASSALRSGPVPRGDSPSRGNPAAAENAPSTSGRSESGPTTK